MMESFGGVVVYNGWYHTDNRSGKGMFIDLTHVKVPENAHNCENFDFSAVKHIQISWKE